MQPHGVGWVEVICGSMFSGKTEELIRRVKRALYARQIVEVFKPALDSRYHPDSVVTHDRIALEGRAVRDVGAMRAALNPRAEVIGIDEAQFFGSELVAFCEEMAESGCRVVVAGLDLDWRGAPFGPMPELLCRAEYVTKLHAICTECGNPAHYSWRSDASAQQVLVGGKERYQARCRRCRAPERVSTLA